MVTVQCICGFRMQAEASDLGRNARCVNCGATFRLWPLDEDKKSGTGTAWYLRIGNNQLGPFTAGDLAGFVAEGRIQKDSLVRRGDEGPWTPAALVRGLLDAKRPAPQPAPSARKPQASAARGGHRSAEPERSRSREAPVGAARTLANHPGILVTLLLGACAIGVLVFIVTKQGKEKEKAKAPALIAKNEPRVEKPATPPPAPPKPPDPLTPQALVARAGPSVAVLEGRSGSGSGFLVGPGLLATNRHVIEFELIEHVRARWPDGGKENKGLYGVQLVYEDPQADLALLLVESKLAALPIATDDGYQKGQEVLCIGSPGLISGQVLSNAISRGLLGTKVVFDGQDYLQLDSAVNPGNSGGPVFNMDGKVVGIVTLKASRLDSVGFCLPVVALRGAMDRARGQSAAMSARGAALHRLRVCAGALLRLSGVYSLAGYAYLAAMDKSLRAKEDINVGLRKAQDAVADVLIQVGGEVTFLVREHAHLPAKDEALESKSRAKYGELLALYAELRDHVDRPHGTLDTFRTTQASCADRLQHLRAHFINEEGVRFPGE